MFLGSNFHSGVLRTIVYYQSNLEVINMKNEIISKVVDAKKTEEAYEISMSDVTDAYDKHGGHFFDDATRRFFKSRNPQYATKQGQYFYFITSEKYDYDSPRLYTLRCMCEKCGSITTIGDFQKYESSREAKANLKRILKQDVKPCVDTFNHGKYVTKFVAGD